MTRIRIKITKYTYVIVICLSLCGICLTEAQYNGEMGHSYGGYNGYDEQVTDDSGADSRPKVHLGIRLKIPAIKFELPRFNMPKITVSARIRQPDRPRVITLPEINLDTSSKVAPPGAQNVNSNYQPQISGYNGHHYGGQKNHASENTQTFSFSTDSEMSPVRYNYNNQNYANNYNPGSVHGSTNLHPSYFQAVNRQNRGQYNNQYNSQTNQRQNFRTLKEAEVGFNEPVYVAPGNGRSKRYTHNQGNYNLRPLMQQQSG